MENTPENKEIVETENAPITETENVTPVETTTDTVAETLETATEVVVDTVKDLLSPNDVLDDDSQASETEETPPTSETDTLEPAIENPIDDSALEEGRKGFGHFDFLNLDSRVVDSTGKPIHKQIEGNMVIREIGLHDIHIPPRSKMFDLDIADLEERIHLWGLIEPLHVIPYRPDELYQDGAEETDTDEDSFFEEEVGVEKDILDLDESDLADLETAVEDAVDVLETNVATVPIASADDFPDDDPGVKYILIHGYRRYLALLSLGKATAPAVVDTTRPKEIVRYLEVMANNVKTYNFEELMAFGKYIEERQKGFSHETIEGILGLPSGQYLKMTYIDSNKYLFEEIYDKVVSGKMTIDAAFKKIEKEANAGNIPGEGNPTTNTEGQAPEDMQEGMESMLDDEDPHVQKKGERHPLKPALRKEVERRDFFTCQACGEGRESTLYSAIFHAHHMIPVKHGGPDDANNLIMLCPNCHGYVHSIDEGRFLPKKKMVMKSEVLRNIVRLASIVNKGLPQDAEGVEPYQYYMAEAEQLWITDEIRARIAEMQALEEKQAQDDADELTEHAAAFVDPKVEE